MNETSSSSQIQEQIAALRRQSFTLLLALIIVSGTLTVFLYRQASLTRRDIAAVKPQATQIIQAYTQNGQNIQNFVKELSAFGAAHPDFQPLLKKYGIAPAAAPVVAPARKK